MAEEPNSWLRRANFSHTVCHRLDSSMLETVPFTIQSERNSGLKSRPGNSNLHRSPTTNRQRSVSPLPEITLSDTFREARSDQKRFSTPRSREEEYEKVIKGRIFRDDRRNSSPPKQSTSVKVAGISKFRKDSSWTKYFDHRGGKVTSVEESVDKWPVDLSKLFIGARFARGAHSRLYHGMYKDEAVAIKIIGTPDNDENGAIAGQLEKEFSREVTLLSHLHHPNVIKFVAASRNPPVYCVITRYLPGGSLRAYLHKLEGESLPLRKLIAIALDIGRGMEYIHSQDVIHRDLKPENILIDQDFRMVIADFGIACREAYGECSTHDPGTYRWMAPEMIKHKPYGRKVDVYSFGLILWEMATGTVPYEDMNPIQAAFAVVNKNLRPTIPPDCPPALGALIEQCWSVQPEKRPEFWEVVKVLEQFESSLGIDGTLNLAQRPSFEDHKKGVLHWIHKLGHVHSHNLPI